MSRIPGRPANERPFLLRPVGDPAADARVPRRVRKPLEEILSWNRAATAAGGLNPPFCNGMSGFPHPLSDHLKTH